MATSKKGDKTKLDIAAIREIAKRVRRVAAQLDATAESVDLLEAVEDLDFEKYATMMRGLGWIEGFSLSAMQRVQSYKYERGDFVAKGESPPDLTR